MNSKGIRSSIQHHSTTISSSINLLKKPSLPKQIPNTKTNPRTRFPLESNPQTSTMHFGKSTIALMAAFAFSNAAVVNLFSDTNCQNPAGSRNVWDNSCAPLGGFQSYMITSGGGGGQFVTAYSRNACAGDATSCVGAGSVGTCFQAINGNGGSNAMSSGTMCGVA